MLSPLRQAACRSLPRVSFARTISVLSDTTLGDGLRHLDIPESPIKILPIAEATLPTPPPSTLLRPGQPPILDIPPAEDPLLSYLTNSIMKHGNRKRAARIVSRTLLWIHTFTRAPPLPILRKAIIDASPFVRAMTHRHGAKNVSMPIALSEKQRTRFAVQWVLKESRNKSGQTLEERLAREIIAVIQGSTKVLENKARVHDFATANR
ncbi:hypothetical protein EW146_g4973 [Bondarzewia mesenterica]|uniref:Small ribosomal subunit protein uS7 domain-containing protein n=1 Tax=Bondarzewia mesenterica TaxID=1095465 RepID=A0A4S4LSV2_9AGAM|nr:hypothetical protein EW146_g4973 [Bondarzewia mesenterica]